MSEIDDKTVKNWTHKANWFMFQLIESKPDGFCADEFYELCRGANISPATIKSLAGKLFREFQAAGYIRKTDKFRLSRRNSSTPLPIWVKLSCKLPAITACELAEISTKEAFTGHGEAHAIQAGNPSNYNSTGEI